jgi:hypothetical protein
MLTQTFVVTLEVPSPFDWHFPRVEAERMANIIRDGVEAKSVSFMGTTPFRIRVERTDEAASVSGQMREYSPDEFPEVEEAVRGQVTTVEAVQVK